MAIVESGTQRFALVVENEEKAMKFAKRNSMKRLERRWNRAYTKAEGSSQERVLKANKKVIGSSEKSGIGIYKNK